MTGGAVAFAALLGAVFLFVIAALLWQEAKQRRFDPGLVYVVEDAVDFIVARLAEPAVGRLRRSDVLRIVEWEVFYLQGLAQENRRNPVDTIAGGADAAIDFIVGEIAEEHRVTYAREDIAAVLQLEAQYLESIGAVGERVNRDSGETAR